MITREQAGAHWWRGEKSVLALSKRKYNDRRWKMLWLSSQCLLCYWFRERSKSVSARPSLREGQSSILRCAFRSTQNSGNFGWYIKWNGPVRFGPTGIFETSFKGGPLWLVWSFWSVGPKYPFPFDKIVVPSTALLNPTYKDNNQTRSGLGRVCGIGIYRSIGHVKFPKFQTGIFVEWKAPSVLPQILASTPFLHSVQL